MNALPVSLTAALPEQEYRQEGIGFCWLCRRDQVRVKWIGPVKVSVGTAPMYGCLDCEVWMQRMVELYNAQRDRS